MTALEEKVENLMFKQAMIAISPRRIKSEGICGLMIIKDYLDDKIDYLTASRMFAELIKESVSPMSVRSLWTDLDELAAIRNRRQL